MYSILLFDLDGSLSDPLEAIARSINHALETHALEPRALAELARFVGPPLDQSFELSQHFAFLSCVDSGIAKWQ